MSKHTPCEQETISDDAIQCVTDDDRLYSSAPTMLEALKGVVYEFGIDEDSDAPWAAAVREALKLAEGE